MLPTKNPERAEYHELIIMRRKIALLEQETKKEVGVVERQNNQRGASYRIVQLKEVVVGRTEGYETDLRIWTKEDILELAKSQCRWAEHDMIFAARMEPALMKQKNKYICLRMCIDKKILLSLEAELNSRGPDAVVMPWLDRPFGIACGYGLYSRKEADALQTKRLAEGWPDPIPGYAYDLEWVVRRLKAEVVR